MTHVSDAVNLSSEDRPPIDTPRPVSPEESAAAWELLNQFFEQAAYERWAAEQREKCRTANTAARLRAIQQRTGDPELAELADEVAAIEDRLLLAEAAIHHIADRLRIDPHRLPDALRPRLYTSGDDDAEVPL